MTDYVNTREIMVNALQRSGHHAFVMELLRSTDKFCFLNCIRDHRIYSRRYILSHPEERFLNDLDLDLDEEMKGSRQAKNLFVYNTEMHSTADAQAIFYHPELPSSIGASKNRHFVTWLRDPLNNLASLFQSASRLRNAGKIKGRLSDQPKLKAARALWIDHMQQVEHPTDGIAIVFNRWLRDDSYREAIFAKFSLPMPPRADVTTRWGNGSSFSRFEAGQKAPSIDELERRCELFMDDQEFRELFADREFSDQIDLFFSLHPELVALSDRWNKLRKFAPAPHR